MKNTKRESIIASDRGRKDMAFIAIDDADRILSSFTAMDEEEAQRIFHHLKGEGRLVPLAMEPGECASVGDHVLVEDGVAVLDS